MYKFSFSIMLQYKIWENKKSNARHTEHSDEQGQALTMRLSSFSTLLLYLPQNKSKCFWMLPGVISVETLKQ